MRKPIDSAKIAKKLGAVRKGRVAAGAGYFGALQLLAEIEARFRVPGGGGRATDPRWSERRLVPLAPRTLARLEKIAARVGKRGGIKLEPMQLAALLLERTTDRLSEDEAAELARERPAAR